MSLKILGKSIKSSLTKTSWSDLTATPNKCDRSACGIGLQHVANAMIASEFASFNERYKDWYTDFPSYLFSTVELKDNTIIVVLGASGDLAKKKTV